jgi:uncharacterized protein (DUF2235 family)
LRFVGDAVAFPVAAMGAIMARNICIFSDGTGQAGGDNPINWTNVYRLYKHTRDADPARQICFYDPGLGAHPDGEEPGLFRRALNILSQATGYGITTNIVDCYTALLLSYEPGDQVFLFGFSRGAYTVRSIGGAIGLCGVPPGLPKLARWSELQRSLAHEVRAIAEEAVTRVYQERDETKRHEAAAAFRQRYGSQELPPTFVGVWDTVRALGVKGLNSFTLGRHSFNNNRLNKGVPHAARRWPSTRTARPSRRNSGRRTRRAPTGSSKSGSPASTPMSAAATG